MSGVFEKRAECFEKRFVISEEVRFKALARRNKLVGLWAAQLLGYDGEAAKNRADALVQAQIGQGDDETLAMELRGELARGGVEISAHRIRRKMDQAMAQAVEGIQAGR
jgi:hypothetical protein